MILNIIGTGIGPIYYALYCNTIAITFYLIIIVSFGVIFFIILIQDWIHKNKNQKYKPILFAIFGSTYIFPMIHLFITEFLFDNFGDTFTIKNSFIWYLMVGFNYLFGLFIFIKKYYFYYFRWP